MNKLLDLRFVIGLFFLATGVLLAGYYLLTGKSPGDYPSVNLWCGSVFLLFGTFMVFVSYKNKIEE